MMTFTNLCCGVSYDSKLICSAVLFVTFFAFNCHLIVTNKQNIDKSGPKAHLSDTWHLVLLLP
jgi:hypothetical protein